MKLTETRASTALNPSKLPGLDWALNPYRGCGHGCAYCYSADILHLKPMDEWGRFVEARTNIPVLVSKERKGLKGTVGLGTVTDPYQPAEERFRLTRYCLEQLAKANCRVCIQTKSDLVSRDVDIIAGKKGWEVGMTITTMDREIAGKLEPGAPGPARRVAALGELASAGIATWVFLGPIIPGMNDSYGSLTKVISTAKEAGAGKIIYDHIRLKPMLRARMTERLGHDTMRAILRDSTDREWRERVGVDVEIACEDARLRAEKAF